MEPVITAVQKFHREVELLKELRIRLVADIITGKLDVREAAKSIPEELEDISLINEDEVEVTDSNLDLTNSDIESVEI